MLSPTPVLGLADAVICREGRESDIHCRLRIAGEGRDRAVVLVHKARSCLTDGVVAASGVVLGIAALTVAGNMNDDELGIPAPQHIVAQPPLCQRAGLPALDVNVGILENLFEYLSALRRGNVKSEGTAVAAFYLNGERNTRARGVGNAGIFQPDEIGAVVGKHRCAHGTCHVRGTVHDLQTVQNAEIGFIHVLPHGYFSFVY